MRYPTRDGWRPKWATRDGVMGPVTVKTRRRWRNTASMTHATLTYCAVVPGANPSSSSRRRDGFGSRSDRPKADDAATERRRGRAGITRRVRDIDACDAGRDAARRSHRPPRAGRRIVKPRATCRWTGPPMRHGPRCRSGATADLAARWSAGGGGDADGDALHDARRDAPIESTSPSVADSPARSIPRDREGAATRAACGYPFKPLC